MTTTTENTIPATFDEIFAAEALAQYADAPAVAPEAPAPAHREPSRADRLFAMLERGTTEGGMKLSTVDALSISMQLDAELAKERAA